MFVYKHRNIDWVNPKLRVSENKFIPISDEAMQDLAWEYVTVRCSTQNTLSLGGDLTCGSRREAECLLSGWRHKFFPEDPFGAVSIMLSKKVTDPLPIMMATHARLGAASPLSKLDTDILQTICKLTNL